jgi:hypothetical protein
VLQDLFIGQAVHTFDYAQNSSSFFSYNWAGVGIDETPFFFGVMLI